MRLPTHTNNLPDPQGWRLFVILCGGLAGLFAGGLLLEDIAAFRPKDLVFLAGTSITGSLVALRLHSLIHYAHRGRLYQLAIAAAVGSLAGELMFLVTRITGIAVISASKSMLAWAGAGAVSCVLLVVLMWYGDWYDRRRSW